MPNPRCLGACESVRRYDRHLKIGGCKIFLDGSPQGRTAWMTEPYENGDPSYCGYPVMSDAEVTDAAAVSANLGLQLLAHCNCDAAARQFLSCLAKSADIGKLRPVMIHAQFAGEGELDEMKRLGVMPSFFVAHVYHWGDEHIVNFGLHRASRISPAASALARGIKFTFHQDAPVIAPDMLETVWCAVNRVTEKGNLLGAEERISVYDALKAVTVNAAYQNFEENEKGTIEPGKAADLVILEDDPLSVAPQKIRYIRVSETVKGGESVYRR